MNLSEFIDSLPLGKILSIKKYKQGQRNDTYKVTTSKGNYSLRVYNDKEPAQIKFELKILEHLKGFQAPRPVKLNKGFLKKFNKKHIVVYKYIPGRHLTRFNKKQLQEVGKFIGVFQNRCEKFVWKKWRYQFYNLPDWKINKFEKISRKAKLKYLKFLPEIIKELKQNRLSSKLRRGPIHVDIKPENVLFDKGKLSGVLDFDNSYIGPLILDLAKSMVWFGTRNKKFYVEDAIPIYQGFIKERKLNQLELQEFYKAVKFAFLSHVFVDYYMRAIAATTQEYFEWIVNDLYKSYKTFKLTEQEFKALLRM